MQQSLLGSYCTTQYNDTVLSLLFYLRLHFSSSSFFLAMYLAYFIPQVGCQEDCSKSYRRVFKLKSSRYGWISARASIRRQYVSSCNCFVCVLYLCHGLLGDLARFRQEFRDTRERMQHFLSRNMFSLGLSLTWAGGHPPARTKL